MQGRSFLVGKAVELRAVFRFPDIDWKGAGIHACTATPCLAGRIPGARAGMLTFNICVPLHCAGWRTANGIPDALADADCFSPVD